MTVSLYVSVGVFVICVCICVRRSITMCRLPYKPKRKVYTVVVLMTILMELFRSYFIFNTHKMGSKFATPNTSTHPESSSPLNLFNSLAYTKSCLLKNIENFWHIEWIIFVVRIAQHTFSGVSMHCIHGCQWKLREQIEFKIRLSIVESMDSMYPNIAKKTIPKHI